MALGSGKKSSGGGGLFGGFFDAVGDVFDAVGDVVESVVDVVEDVVETVGNVVEAVIEDPLPVLVAVAGQAVGIPAPITMGAITAARGGDLEDIALSMGTAAFAPSVGSAISSTVSSTFIEAGLNETFSQIASNSISQGLVNGTIAEIKGGSFEDGFAGGLTGGLVSSGIGEVASYVKPDIVELAMENGLDLQDANAIYKAGTKAVTSGVTAEITGRGDFVTSFTNSAVGSTIDYGVRELNSTIDEQFATAATDWNEKDKEGETIDTTAVGGGIPNDIVSQVTVSDIGFDTTADDSLTDTTNIDSAIDAANVLDDYSSTTAPQNLTPTPDEIATSDISVLPETQLAGAPQGETVYDFADLIGEKIPDSEDTALADNTYLSDVIADAGLSDTGFAEDYLDETSIADTAGEEDFYNIPENVIDIAENIPTDELPATPVEPKGALTTIAETPQNEDVYDFASLYDEAPEFYETLFENAPSKAEVPESVIDIAESIPTDDELVDSVEPKGALETMAEAPEVDFDTTAPAFVPEAPLADNLLTSGLSEEKPEGGLNAVSQASQLAPEQKMANSMGLKPTDITKPLVATVGNLLKKSLTQQRRPAPRTPVRTAGARPVQRKAPPPQRMDVAKLIPIQKAAPVQKAAPTTRVAPPKTLGGDAKLSPITDIATLTSLLKNKG